MDTQPICGVVGDQIIISLNDMHLGLQLLQLKCCFSDIFFLFQLESNYLKNQRKSGNFQIQQLIK